MESGVTPPTLRATTMRRNDAKESFAVPMRFMAL
jgi:hypothetical protein